MIFSKKNRHTSQQLGEANGNQVEKLCWMLKTSYCIITPEHFIQCIYWVVKENTPIIVFTCRLLSLSSLCYPTFGGVLYSFFGVFVIFCVSVLHVLRLWYIHTYIYICLFMYKEFLFPGFCRVVKSNVLMNVQYSICIYINIHCIVVVVPGIFIFIASLL